MSAGQPGLILPQVAVDEVRALKALARTARHPGG